MTAADYDERARLPTARSMDRNRRTVAGLALAALVGCVRVDRISSSEPLDRGEILARGQVTTATGGTLTAGIGGEFEGVRLIIPPGAVPADVEVVLRGRFGHPRLPSIVQTIEVEPRELQLNRAAQLTLRYSTTYARTAGQVWPESEVEVYGFQTAPIDDERVYILAYVDDLLISSASMEAIDYFKTKVFERFKARDLGEAELYLGIKIQRDRGSRVLMLSQGLMAEELVAKYGLTDGKTTTTPLTPAT